MLTDLHQSSMHSDVLRRLGWSSAGENGSKIYYRQLGPLTIAKLQRPKTIDLAWLKSFRHAHHTLTTYIEPSLTSDQAIEKIGFATEPFAHSATSLVDLMPSDHIILSRFTQKTRYNITHSLKKDDLSISSHKLGHTPPTQMQDFFALQKSWSKTKDVIGYSDALLDATLASFKDSGTLHFAYLGDALVASLLVLYHDHVATYWAAFALSSGYKSFSPTLLTWTAMQHAKSHGYTIFDFGGIYDPRYPKMYKRWQGFTKFKSGFNPEVVLYPKTTLQLFW